MKPLSMTRLKKHFPGYDLEIDFEVPKGFVTGLVGANGAGKTTLIKCALGTVIPDAGNIQLADKQDNGVVLDAPPYSTEWRAGDAGRAIGRFYRHWDQMKFEALCTRWDLELGKRVKELSRGMGMKLQLAVAFSNDAKFLILDEPTSGLDPLTRDELLENNSEFMLDPEYTVLFSSHVTSDLEKVADHVAALDDGRLRLHDELDVIKGRHRIARGGGEPPRDANLIGLRTHSVGWEALVDTKDVPLLGNVAADHPTLEDIIIRHAKNHRDSRQELQNV